MQLYLNVSLIHQTSDDAPRSLLVQLLQQWQPAHVIPIHSYSRHVIAICVQPYSVNFKIDGRWKTEYYTCGDTLIFPAYELSPFAQCDRTAQYR